MILALLLGAGVELETPRPALADTGCFGEPDAVETIAEVFADYGYSVPASAVEFDTYDEGERVLLIKLSLTKATMEEMLMLAFVGGGAADSLLCEPVDAVSVRTTLSFREGVYLLSAPGESCRRLFAGELEWEDFLRGRVYETRIF